MRRRVYSFGLKAVEMETLEVEVKISYEDYAKAMWFKYMRIGGRAWPLPLMLALLTAAMLCVEAWYLIHGELMDDPIYWLSLALTVLYIPIFLAIRYLYIRLGFGLRRDQCYTMKYTFSETGIRAEKFDGSKQAAKEYAHRDIRRTYETREAFYIDVDGDEYLVVLKGGLGAETAEKIRSRLADKLKIVR